MNKISPFFSSYMPVKYAIAGLSKLNPNYKKFLENALAWGYPAQEALDYLKGRVFGPSSQQEKTNLESSSSLRPDEQASLQGMKRREAPFEAGKEIAGTATKLGGLGIGLSALSGLGKQDSGQNSMQQDEMLNQNDPLKILASYSPELAQHVKTEMQKGKNLQTIGAILKTSPMFQKDVSRIENETKKHFFDWFLSLFEGSAPVQQQNVQQGQPQASPQQNMQGGSTLPTAPVSGSNREALLGMGSEILNELRNLRRK